MTHDGSKGWIFDLVCPSYALNIPHKRLLLLKNATVNWNLGFDNICKEKKVSIAYNNFPNFFSTYWDYENNRQMEEMVEFPVKIIVPDAPHNIAHKWEIQKAFFESNNIRPIWHWAGGRMNYTSSQWSGPIGLIQRDEVDYAVNTFICDRYAGIHLIPCSQGDHFTPYYIFTRYPKAFPPTWNLTGLFTKG